jgi:serine/threonine-protein kinase
MALLPPGYDNAACQEVHPPATGALATVDCGQSSTPGGPSNARYSLFADQATLDAHFDGAVKENSELFQCPGSGIDSPTTWHYTKTPANVEGRIACGTYNNGPDLVWSKNSDLLLADAQSPNMDDLHKWWLKYG